MLQTYLPLILAPYHKSYTSRHPV